jgi:putative heme iron utilization protein
VATTFLPREMPLDCIPEAALNAAKNLIQAELEGLLDEKKLSVIASSKAKSESDALDLLGEENARTAMASGQETIYQTNVGWVDVDGNKDPAATVDAVVLEFETLQEATASRQNQNWPF